MHNTVQYYTFSCTIQGNIVHFIEQFCEFLYASLKTSNHRGQALAAAVKKSRMKISELIRRVDISRGTYYNHIGKKDLAFEILEMYGKVLRYDFSEDFPKMPKYTFEEDETIYGTPKTLEEALRHIDYWKTRYIQLSDEYRKEVEKRK